MRLYLKASLPDKVTAALDGIDISICANVSFLFIHKSPSGDKTLLLLGYTYLYVGKVLSSDSFCPKEDIMKNLRNVVNNFNRSHEEYPSLDGELIAHLKGVINFCDHKATKSYYDIFGPVAENLKKILSAPYGTDLGINSQFLRDKFGTYYHCVVPNMGSLATAVANGISAAEDEVLNGETSEEIQKFVKNQLMLIFNKIDEKDFLDPNRVEEILSK